MNATDQTAPLPHPARPLSAELTRLRDTFAERPATLREIAGVLSGRAYELLMILCVLPFLVPVSVPGMSTPLGMAVAVIAGQLAFGRLPWLPRRLLDRPLPAGFLTKVLRVTQGVVQFVERVLRPRWLSVTGAPWLNGVHLGVVCAAALLLPLPIPFTNTFPGWTILLFACGLMERDGLLVLAGYAMMVATAVLFFLLGATIQQTLSAMWRWLAG